MGQQEDRAAVALSYADQQAHECLGLLLAVRVKGVQIRQRVQHDKRRLYGSDLPFNRLQNGTRPYPAILTHGGENGILANGGPQQDAPAMLSRVNIKAPAHVREAAVQLVLFVFCAIVERHPGLGHFKAQPFGPGARCDGELDTQQGFAIAPIACEHVNGLGGNPVRHMPFPLRGRIGQHVSHVGEVGRGLLYSADEGFVFDPVQLFFRPHFVNVFVGDGVKGRRPLFSAPQGIGDEANRLAFGIGFRMARLFGGLHERVEYPLIFDGVAGYQPTQREGLPEERLRPGAVRGQKDFIRGPFQHGFRIGHRLGDVRLVFGGHKRHVGVRGFPPFLVDRASVQIVCRVQIPAFRKEGLSRVHTLHAASIVALRQRERLVRQPPAQHAVEPRHVPCAFLGRQRPAEGAEDAPARPLAVLHVACGGVDQPGNPGGLKAAPRLFGLHLAKIIVAFHAADCHHVGVVPQAAFRTAIRPERC